MIEEILKDKDFIKLVDLAELSTELLIMESNKGSLHRIYKQCDHIRENVNKVNAKLKDNEQKRFYNRIFERALEKSISILDKDFHQAETYFVQDLLSHIRSF
jgi:hypothetical protein